MNLKIGILLTVLVLFVTAAFAIRRFIVTKPDGTIDSANLENIINDIYDSFQTKKFNKFNTVPEINQISEQQIVLYKSGTTGKLYTLIDDTSFYVTLTKSGFPFIVTEYTQLGGTAPRIKLVKLSTNTACYEGGITNIAHGLTLSKIISISPLVQQGATQTIPPIYTTDPNYQYDYFCNNLVVYINLHATNSGNILNKPVTILVTYEE